MGSPTTTALVRYFGGLKESPEYLSIVGPDDRQLLRVDVSGLEAVDAAHVLASELPGLGDAGERVKVRAYLEGGTQVPKGVLSYVVPADTDAILQTELAAMMRATGVYARELNRGYSDLVKQQQALIGKLGQSLVDARAAAWSSQTEAAQHLKDLSVVAGGLDDDDDWKGKLVDALGPEVGKELGKLVGHLVARAVAGVAPAGAAGNTDDKTSEGQTTSGGPKQAASPGADESNRTSQADPDIVADTVS